MLLTRVLNNNKRTQILVYQSSYSGQWGTAIWYVILSIYKGTDCFHSTSRCLQEKMNNFSFWEIYWFYKYYMLRLWIHCPRGIKSAESNKAKKLAWIFMREGRWADGRRQVPLTPLTYGYLWNIQHEHRKSKFQSLCDDLILLSKLCILGRRRGSDAFRYSPLMPKNSRLDRKFTIWIINYIVLWWGRYFDLLSIIYRHIST